jgi:hypothetical protein
MSRRPTAATLVEARANCERCAWSTVGNNAQALAAQHFDKKGHRVVVTLHNQIIYGALSGATRSEPQGSLRL